MSFRVFFEDNIILYYLIQRIFINLRLDLFNF